LSAIIRLLPSAKMHCVFFGSLMIRMTVTQLSRKKHVFGFSKFWIVDDPDHGSPAFQEKHTFFGFSKFWFADDPDHGSPAFEEKTNVFRVL
jgi:hypothetical protein